MFRSAPSISVLLLGTALAVYIASEDGQVFVLKAGPAYEGIAMNEMSTPVLATPAISHGRLLLRTQDVLMGIGKK